jgi:hypothetical protein
VQFRSTIGSELGQWFAFPNRVESFRESFLMKQINDFMAIEDAISIALSMTMLNYAKRLRNCISVAHKIDCSLYSRSKIGSDFDFTHLNYGLGHYSQNS